MSKIASLNRYYDYMIEEEGANSPGTVFLIIGFYGGNKLCLNYRYVIGGCIGKS